MYQNKDKKFAKKKSNLINEKKILSKTARNDNNLVLNYIPNYIDFFNKKPGFLTQYF